MNRKIKIIILVLVIIIVFTLDFLILWKLYLRPPVTPVIPEKKEVLPKVSHIFGYTSGGQGISFEADFSKENQIPEGLPKEFPIDYKKDRIQGKVEIKQEEDSSYKEYTVLVFKREKRDKVFEKWNNYLRDNNWEIVMNLKGADKDMLSGWRGENEGINIHIFSQENEENNVIIENPEDNKKTIIGIQYWVSSINKQK